MRGEPDGARTVVLSSVAGERTLRLNGVFRAKDVVTAKGVSLMMEGQKLESLKTMVASVQAGIAGLAGLSGGSGGDRWPGGDQVGWW